MSTTRLYRNLSNFHADPKFGRILLVSLLAHGLILVGFGGGWLGSGKRTKPPVYYVDLVHKPVLDPQAGRPDPRPVKQQAAPVKKTAPAPVVKPKPKPKAVPKPVVKATPQPVPKPETRADDKLKDALESIREKQAHQAEIDAIKQKLAALQSDTAAPRVAEDVPVGMPDGTGTEVGVSVLAYIQAYIQQNWALSPYLLDRSKLGSIEAKVLLVYSATGELIRYRILEPSGDSQFDDSIKRAIIKSKQLQQKLPKSTELTVIFNLKEMADARR